MSALVRTLRQAGALVGAWLAGEARGDSGVTNPVHPGDPALAQMFRTGPDSLSGVEVTERTVLGLPGYWSGINAIAESLSSAPLRLYRRDESGGRTEVASHPLRDLLCSQSARPCAWMTRAEWTDLQVRNGCIWGDSVNHIVLDARGRVSAIEPMESWRRPVRVGGRLAYSLGDGKVLLDDEVLRLPYKLGPDGQALAPLDLHQTTFGTAIAARAYQAALLGNMATPKGALLTPGVLDPEAARRLREDWDRMHRGPANAGRVAILDLGIKYEQLGMSNVDAQFAELLQLTLGDISRILRVPPHMLSDLSRATFSNIEHQSIEFVRHTLLPWAERHEARLDGWLLSAEERAQGLHIAYDFNGLMRGDARSRAEYYRNMFYMSALSPNEIRTLEGLPRVEGGDQLYVQGATVPIDLARVMAGEMAERGAGAPA